MQRGLIMKTNILSIIFGVSFFLILCMSCGQNRTGWKGTIEKTNGMTLVKNPKQGLWDSKENAAVTMIQERQIGGELEGPEKSLFAFIIDLAVNSKGDIYVADRRLNEIRKFDKNGTYLSTVGRQGQGPGEFQSIRSLSVNTRDDLIVFDNMLGRISIFSDNGEHIQTTKKLMTDSWIEPAKIFPADGRYILFGKLSDSLQLFHEFDRDWNLKDSYIDYEFFDNREFEELQFGSRPGNCIVQKSGDILYAKYLYDNQILIYNNKKLVKKIIRESDIKRPYDIQMFRDVKKAMEIKDPEYDFKIFGQGIAFIGKTYQCSLGLYQLSDGYLVNFLSLRRSKDLWELGVEFYDSEGKFLKYAKLGDNLFYDLRCKDSNDLFYAIQRKEYHKVVIFRLGY
jgi:hypothetical protein